MTTPAKTGYFLDFQTLNWLKGTEQKNKTYTLPINSTIVMGDITNQDNPRHSVKRSELASEGYTIGITSELPSAAKKTYKTGWNNLVLNVFGKKDWNSATTNEKAELIFKNMLLYPDDRPFKSEGTKTANGGYVFWAQDLELDAKQKVDSPDAIASFAGIMAILWAGRQKYDNKLNIIPIVSNSIITNLHVTTCKRKNGSTYDCFGSNPQELVDLKKVFNLVTQYLPNPTSTNQPSLKWNYFQTDPTGAKNVNRKSWNFMSLLKLNNLIDGFILEAYQDAELSNDELKMTPFIAPFYTNASTIPYALMGSWSGPKQLPHNSPTPLISTSFNDPNNIMPLNSAIYFSNQSTDQTAVKNLHPGQYFKPVPNILFAYNASIPQYSEDASARVIDLSTLPESKYVKLDIHLSREAIFSSYSGFYCVLDSDGTVNDPITGESISPGQSGYKAAALAESNLVKSLTELQLHEDGSIENAAKVQLNGGIMMAPYAVITEPGKQATYFDFASANPDGISHFKQISMNTFGMEDIYGGGDFDYNDLIISVQFTEII